MSRSISINDFASIKQGGEFSFYQIKNITSEGYISLSFPNKPEIILTVTETKRKDHWKIPSEYSERGIFLNVEITFMSKQQYDEHIIKLNRILSLSKEELYQFLLNLNRNDIDNIFGLSGQLDSEYNTQQFWKEKYEKDFGFIYEGIDEEKFLIENYKKSFGRLNEVINKENFDWENFDWEREHGLRDNAYKMFINRWNDLKYNEVLNVSRLGLNLLGIREMALGNGPITSKDIKQSKSGGKILHEQKMVSNNMVSLNLALKLLKHAYP